MDIDGVAAEILFPPQRTMSHFLGDDDDDFVLAGVEAYNNFLFEEFCAPDPKRLVGMAQIPSVGIDTRSTGCARPRRAARRACSSPTGRRARNACRVDDDPFWAAAVDEGMPVTIHINIISREQRMAGRKAAAARGNQLYDMSSEATRAKAIGGMSHVFAMATGAITDMIFTVLHLRRAVDQSEYVGEFLVAGEKLLLGELGWIEAVLGFMVAHGQQRHHQLAGVGLGQPSHLLVDDAFDRGPASEACRAARSSRRCRGPSARAPGR